MHRADDRSFAAPTETGTAPSDRIGAGYARPGTADHPAAPGTTAAVVDQFNQAWNDHDLSAALALISEDCVFESTAPAPDGARAVGKSAIRAAWAPIFADASARFTIEESFSAGTRLVQRWRYDWIGGHIRGVDVIAVQEGLVTEKLAYVKG
jgi:hypothetical protein